MPHWRTILGQSITGPAQISTGWNIDRQSLTEVVGRYPMRVNPYYLSLMREVGDPIWRQAMPDVRELTDQCCLEDPLGEEDLSRVPNLIHKYPDRVLFLVHSQCAVYCRFCTRKRKVGTRRMQITPETIRAGLAYIQENRAIRDVLVSGGDPLLLPDEELDELLGALRRISHVEIIRIGTRVPCTLPMRITTRLVKVLKKYHPLYINTHFNHPREITPQSSQACARLANAGIPLGSQTVLLRGVNDDPAVIIALMRRLLTIRVKPYYLFQGDMTRGTDHFRTPVERGVAIIKEMIGHVSGMAIPALALDAPGGMGKIRLLPDYQMELGTPVTFVNYQGAFCSYQNPG